MELRLVDKDMAVTAKDMLVAAKHTMVMEKWTKERRVNMKGIRMRVMESSLTMMTEKHHHTMRVEEDITKGVDLLFVG